ncbi:MAG: fibrobacter succinogenes major paralogous domain-containing protein, partial [Patescibacteria group bacterium]
GYMQILPSAPSVADGTCTPEENNYEYTVGTENSTYTLSFCSGKQVSDLSPGPLCMTPGGITTCVEGGETPSVVDCSSHTNENVCSYNGDSYNIAQIGSQIWFSDNLNTSLYNNGVTEIEFNHDTWTSVVEANNDPAWSWPSDGTTIYQDYGKLYNSFAVETGNLCPSGWHVPTHDELTDLERAVCNLLGNSSCDTTFPYDTTTVGWLGDEEGSALAGGLSLWGSGDLISSLSFGLSGFDALPLGRRYGDGNYQGFGTRAFVWSSTVYDQYYRWTRYMTSTLTEPTRNRDYKTTGFPVRCLKD